MLDPEGELRRKLDDVVGKRYAPSEKGARRRTVGRWLAASACALAAVATILWVLESHRLPKEMPKRVEKPVTVTIVPARPP
ncbi:MAG: hypothetical protein ACXWF0_08910 [Usitatibacter sp.]